MATAARSRAWPVLIGDAVAVLLIAGAGRLLGRADVHSDSFATASTRGLSDGARLMFVLLLIFGMVFSLMMSKGFATGTAESRGDRRSSLVRTIVVNLLYIAAVLLLVRALARLFPAGGPTVGGGVAGGSGTGAHPATSSYPYDWPVILGIALVVVLALAGGWLLHRSRRAVPQPLLDLGSPDVAATDGAVPPYDAYAEHDPRRAVLGLYQWLLAVLRAHGRGRSEWEAPVEHVERVFSGDGHALSAGRRVADAFELARYSDHEVSEAMRSDAAAAARAVADHVQGPDGGGG
jgi:hypothetical protein